MKREAIYHTCDSPFAYPIGENVLKIRIRTSKFDVKECILYHADRYDQTLGEEKVILDRVAWDDTFDYFEGLIVSNTKRVRYWFQVIGLDGEVIWYGEDGASTNPFKAGVFQFPYICKEDIYRVPPWAKNTVVYQILPDRFCNADKEINPPNLSSWEENPDCESYYGGDLRGIIEKLGYIEELGINSIYLTPIFTSPSSHKYDTVDYFQVDPFFGDLETAKELVDKAHNRGIHVILDATFHHCSERFFAFRDVMEKGKDSAYADWFYIHEFPIVQSPIPNYGTFGFLGTMPKFKTHNKELREYLMNIATYWIREVGIDGWRIDVANEIDHEFWRMFRKEVKSINPEVLIIGEVWHNAGPWLRGDQFDGVTNYKIREAARNFFAMGEINVNEFNSLLTKNRMNYNDQANATMFNVLDSHDTERFLTECKRLRGIEKMEDAVNLMKLTVLFQMTYTGIPIIFYGDEVGIQGEMDPDCRKPMIWDKSRQNQEMLAFYKKLIRIRKSNQALTMGEFRSWFEDNEQGVFGYLRSDVNGNVAVILNNSEKTRWVDIEIPWECKSKKVTDLLSNTVFEVGQSNSFELPPFGGLLIV